MAATKVHPSFKSGFSRFARTVNTWVSSPAATFSAFLIVLVWALSGPHFHYSDGWQLVINTGTTIVTFLMVFVLNNAQSRDTAAMNTKLDELILKLKAADNRLVGVERQNDEDAAELRAEIDTAVEKAAQQTETQVSAPRKAR